MDIKKDFEKYIQVHIYINGVILIDNEEDKKYKMNICLNNFENYENEKCDIFRFYIEEEVKKYIIKKIKEKDINLIEISRKTNIPIKNLLHCFFINNRIDNIEIIWSGSAIKEFKYVPTKHYIEYMDDSLILNIKGLKFKKRM